MTPIYGSHSLDSEFNVDNINSPIDVHSKQPEVNHLDPNLSESLPVIGLIIPIAIPPGTNTVPIRSVENRRTYLR